MTLGFLGPEIKRLEEANRLRVLRERTPAGKGALTLDKVDLLHFGSNDYLGLSQHPRIKAAAKRGAEISAGATASRLVAGSWHSHMFLEREVADFLERESCLLFNSGFVANLGILASLTAAGDLLLSDKLNHASIIDGCRLSKANTKVYSHCSVDSIVRLLEENKQANRKFLVTESLFSMDGDVAPLREIADVCARYGVVLIVDEAHAFGVFGSGRGLCSELNVEADVLVGTFGKALGSFGAFVAGNSELIAYLVSKARSFMFTTALPLSVVEANRAALSLIASEEGDRLRDKLFRNSFTFAAKFAEKSNSHIFPIVVGSEYAAMEWEKRLTGEGFFVPAIRPPTVAAGASRLRVVLSAVHAERDVLRLSQLMSSLLKQGLVCSTWNRESDE